MTPETATPTTAPPPSPADLAATEPLSARGLDALYRVETALAWGEL